MNDPVPLQGFAFAQSTQFLFLIFLIGLNALFACLEIAIISFNDNRLDRLAKSGDKRAIKLVSLTEQPAKFLSTIQIGITFAGSFASAFAADNFAPVVIRFFMKKGIAITETTLSLIAVFIITIILGYFNLVFGELVPKRIAMKRAEPIALFLAGFIYFISKIFNPIVWFLSTSTNGILKLVGIDPHDEEIDVTEEEIRLLIDAGTEKGTIDFDEKQLITNVFEFDNKNAEEVMTHRTDVHMLWLDETEDEWEDTIFNGKHSFYPIFNETFDNAVGILSIKDYFRLKNKNYTREQIIEEAVVPPQLVPETVRTDVLFKNMRACKQYFAIVLDDYGGMSGIITIHDLIEELVGDIIEEDDDELEPEIIKIDDETWEIIGTIPLDVVTQELGINIDKDEYDTFGGMVFGILGTIPEDGAQPELEEFNMKIKVLEVKNHRLIKSRVVVERNINENNKNNKSNKNNKNNKND